MIKFIFINVQVVKTTGIKNGIIEISRGLKVNEG